MALIFDRFRSNSPGVALVAQDKLMEILLVVNLTHNFGKTLGTK